MSSDFVVAPVIRTVSPLAATGVSRGVAFVAPAPVAKIEPAPSPNQHYDPSLGLLVVQFVDAKGDVTQSIPNERQLKAYRTGGTR